MSRNLNFNAPALGDKPEPPRSSWWVGLTRQQFRESASREAERMNHQVSLAPTAGAVMDAHHRDRVSATR